MATGAVAALTGAGLLLAATALSRPLRADHKAAAWVFELSTAERTAPQDLAALTRRAGPRLDQAIDLNPWQPLYLTYRANALLAIASSVPDGSPTQMTALRRAQRDLERAIELLPYSTSLLERYADVLLQIHRLDPADGGARAGAVRALRQAVRADPYSTHLRDRLQALVAS